MQGLVYLLAITHCRVIWSQSQERLKKRTSKSLDLCCLGVDECRINPNECFWSTFPISQLLAGIQQGSPMTVGSSSRWFLFAGSRARPRAICVTRLRVRG